MSSRGGVNNSVTLPHSSVTIITSSSGQQSSQTHRHETSATMIEPAIRLRRAIHAGDALLVKRILRTRPSLLLNPDPTPAGLSNSNLHLAAFLGHAHVCAILLEAGHELPCPALNENHRTALMLAARQGHTEVVRLITTRDPSCVLRRDAKGRDAVMEASMGGHDTILQILITNVPEGATEAVRRADNEGNTCLHFATGNGNLLVLRTLLAAGADVDKRNAWNWAPGAYSATVAADVYYKGLVNEIAKKPQLRKEASSKGNGPPAVVNIDPAKMAGGVRVVQADSDDDVR